MTTKIFYTGATGFIGGSVLDSLLQRKDAKEFSVTVLTRQESKAKEFERLGLRAIQGDLDSVDLIREECTKADIVISTADADHEKSVEAMLAGMKKHKEQTGRTSIFIHTSGTGVLVVDAQGRAPKPEDPIYDDTDSNQIATLPDSAPHRVVDLAIVAADTAGEVKSFIILPSTIYGISQPEILVKGSDKDAIMNRHSQQMPAAIQMALERGQPGVYGEGKNIWPHVHIADLQDMYMVIFDQAISGKGDHGKNGFYFGINGHYEYYKAAEAIGMAMHKRNIGKSATPSQYEMSQLKAKMGDMAWYVGSIGQGKGEHARKFGWKPTYTTDDFYASLDEELEAQVAKGNK